MVYFDEMSRLFDKIEMLIRELKYYDSTSDKKSNSFNMSNQFGYPCGLRKRHIVFKESD
jgi:hypothetical protein